MDGRGGCCIARYANGGAYDKVNRIMLRFRPIAPKPMNGGSVSGGSTPDNMTEVFTGGGGRRKRRYAKDNNNSLKRCNNRKRKASPEQKKRGVSGETVVTLPLLSESPEPKESPDERNAGTWLSFENFAGNNNIDDQYNCSYNKVHEVMPRDRPVRMVGSCVTVDCVTDKWVDGEGLGCTDKERRMNLERDTCPGFVSDGVGRVVWTNGAYKNMVGQGGDDEMMAVLLVMKEMKGADLVPAAFTCRVRVQYDNARSSETTSLRSKDSWSSLTLPCDVWRMEGGGFAWRLDVKAALCLGRYGTKSA